MRTLVDIPDNQLKELKALGTARRVSRAQLVREAIENFLAQHRISRDSAFGIWKEAEISLPGHKEPLPQDGVAYQERLRSEW